MNKLKFLLFCLIALFAFNANVTTAQQVGDWKLHHVYSGLHVQNIIDNGKLVYYLSDGYLYAYDKENDETLFFSKRNDLSDNFIKNIYYNFDKEYLFIIYENSNIDIMYNSGKVVNIPDLKNAVLTTEKGINDVDFAGKFIYVATDFGYMVVDDDKYQIKESHNYNKKFTSIIATDKYIYACVNNKIIVSELEAHHYEFSAFTETKYSVENLYKMDNNKFCTASGWFYTFEIGADYKNPSIKVIKEQSVKLVSKSKNGYIASFDGFYMNLDNQGNVVDEVVLPEGEFSGSLISSMENDGSVWGVDKKGIKQFIIKDGGITYLHENFRPNATSVNYPGYMVYKNKRLYTMTSGELYTYQGSYEFGLSSLEKGVWKDLAPDNVHGLINSNSNGVLQSPYALTIDNNDPDKIWFGSWWEGIFCVKNNKQILKFDSTNSPMVLNYICSVPDLKFDTKNNLWAMFSNTVVNSAPSLLYLPADKVNDKVQKSDWTTFSNPSFIVDKQGRMFVTKKGLILAANNIWKTKLMVLDVNNTPANTADDRMAVYATFSDQDGKGVDISFIFDFVEDKNGRIWLATNTGVCYLNQNNLFNKFYVTRVKVPRNDGTNLADYLLDGLSVNAIAIDGANRKWFATSTSGVYLVSEDGTEILNHFTTDNSSLPDNNVVSIECNTDNNIVYMGTPKGIIEYSSDAIPAEDNFDNVYAYPNPVRPDYTGAITIRGLMENSLVKIADSAGNVIYSTKSNGGMVVWDGCNSSGERVNTGVYFVLASQSMNDNSDGCVTKILVVK